MVEVMTLGPSLRRASAYRRVAEQLRDLIQGGHVGEGQRLPTEAELMRQHQLSRQTVRRAYQELVASGLVERVPGRGSFIAPRGHYRRTFSSIEELLALSVDTEMEVVEPLFTGSNAAAAASLGLQFDDVLHVGYRRLHEGLAFSYTDVYLPPRMATYLAGAPFLKQRWARSRTTVLGLLDQVLPHPVVGAKQVVTAIAAPREVANQIDCRESEPILKIVRIHFDADGRPVEQCVNHFNPERYSYSMQLQRHRERASSGRQW
jgi:GntR family transcriptional regulator